MRIIRGKYKTRKYKVPKNFPSRPTTDFAKEGLFNMLEHHYFTEDLSILDLCAGTGNISIEFLSREWGHVVAVDQNLNSVRYLKSVSKELGCEEDLVVVKSEIIKFLNGTTQQFDLIFADPPYAFPNHAEIVKLVFKRKILHPGGVLIVEHGKETVLDELPQFINRKRYGNVYFSFFEYENPAT